MATKRQLQAKETRELLLTTSKQLIVRDGYSKVTISQICNECEVAKGTFYLYFGSKKEIVGEILNDITTETFAQFHNEKTENAAEQLSLFHKIYTNSVLSQGIEFTKEFLLIILSLQLEGQGKSVHQTLVEEILNEGISKGQLKATMDVESFAREYILHLYTINFDWCIRKEDHILIEDSMQWLLRKIAEYRI